MKAITTRYLGPTNTRAARLVASDMDGKRVMIPVPIQDMGVEAMHELVARTFVRKFKWPEDDLICGGIKGGLVWVMQPKARSGA